MQTDTCLAPGDACSIPAGPWALPKRGLALADCWFYHTLDVPDHGTVAGPWDLRAGVDDYLGRVAFDGKRVLEMGTANGFLCFSMEQRGADVVAFDLAPDKKWDLVPLARCPDLGGYFERRWEHLARLRNAFWLCHEAFESRARVVYGTVYDVPATIGPVDVCTFGSILLHLRDPFLALANGLRLTRETVIVTDLLPDFVAPVALCKGVQARPPLWRRACRKLGRLVGGSLLESVPPLPQMVLVGGDHDNLDTWWALSPLVVERFLAILGFEETRVYTHQQLFQGQPRNLFTVVGRRTQPMPRQLDGPYPWF
jgi:hypothetical protein